MAHTLLSIFPNPNDLLALEVEELGGVLLEVIPGVLQNGTFAVGYLDASLLPTVGRGYPPGRRSEIRIVLTEAVWWLVNQGLVVRDSDQPAPWFRLTRRAKILRTRADVKAYRRGRVLPVELLPPIMVEKVWPLFHRGDHDVAVFQAFKEVEVAVRRSANAKGAGYPDDLVGVALMRRAFHPDQGPLADATKVPAERAVSKHVRKILPGAATEIGSNFFARNLDPCGDQHDQNHSEMREMSNPSTLDNI